MNAIYSSGGMSLTRLAAREVTREISVAESNAIMPDLKAKLREMAAFLEKTNKVMAVLRCPADVVFTDPQGRRVGYSGGRQINEIPGAEIRTSGEVEIYILPAAVPFSVAVAGNGSGAANLDIIRPEGGDPAITSFLKMPVNAGTALSGSMAPGGKLASLTGGGATHAPALIGRLSGDRVTWQEPAGPVAPAAPTTPTAAPTATLTICSGHNDGEPFGITDTFEQTGAVYGVLHYENQPPATVERIWMHEGKVVTRGESDIEGDGWAWGWLHTGEPGGLQAGAYELIWRIGDRVIARKPFTVGGPPAAPSQQAPPAQPETADDIVICRNVVNGQPVGAAMQFAGISEVYMLQRYTGQTAGTAEAIWLRDGEELVRTQQQIEGGDGWVSFSLRAGGGKNLSAGLYEVHLRMPGKPAAIAPFFVQ
jgi:hypothetical protein